MLLFYFDTRHEIGMGEAHRKEMSRVCHLKDAAENAARKRLPALWEIRLPTHFSV